MRMYTYCTSSCACVQRITELETELKEPIRVTDSAEFETDPVFIDNGNALLFVGWKNEDHLSGGESYTRVDL